MEPPGRKEVVVDGDGVKPHERKEVFVDGDGVLHIPTRCSTSNLLPTHSPAAVVASGAVVVFHTSDYAYERLSKRDGSQDQPPLTLEEINIVTGPLAVEGAMPGDALHVEILDVQIRRCWSVWMAEAAVSGCLACKLAATGRESSVRQLVIDDANKTVHISQRLHVPLEPMIGVIATAPSLENKSQSSTFEPTYSHGGNMDLREMQKGAAIILPIQIEGGLLFIGDLHACMVSEKMSRQVHKCKARKRASRSERANERESEGESARGHMPQLRRGVHDLWDICRLVQLSAMPTAYIYTQIFWHMNTSIGHMPSTNRI